MQVEAVAKLLAALAADAAAPAATNYLLQHSTGSGKSLTIAALCHGLLGLTDCAGQAFHTVLVVNDRRQLDIQLSDTITAFLAGGFGGMAAHCRHGPSRVTTPHDTRSMARSQLAAATGRYTPPHRRHPGALPQATGTALRLCAAPPAPPSCAPS